MPRTGCATQGATLPLCHMKTPLHILFTPSPSLGYYLLCPAFFYALLYYLPMPALCRIYCHLYITSLLVHLLVAFGTVPVVPCRMGSPPTHALPLPTPPAPQQPHPPVRSMVQSIPTTWTFLGLLPPFNPGVAVGWLFSHKTTHISHLFSKHV